MRHPMMRLSALITAFVLAGIAGAQTPQDGDSSAPPIVQTTNGQVRVAGKVSAPFAQLAGSSENATALATALRTGTPATLAYLAAGNSSETTITPPTKPMGWGNVSHALALAQFTLSQVGVTNPTGAELHAALVGGTVTAADGTRVTMAGVLQQRASGLGWGEIAQSYGTTMGAVNRGIKAHALKAGVPPAPTQTAPRTDGNEAKPMLSRSPANPRIGGNSLTSAGGAGTSSRASNRITTAGSSVGSSQASKGITTAADTSSVARRASKGLTTAGGTPAATGPGAKGLTTASGATSRAGSSRVVTAGGNGNGNAYGRAIVTASGASVNPATTGLARGTSTATVSANGTVASGIVTAHPHHGNGQGNPNGKGKAGG